MAVKNYYAVLGVKQTDSEDTIRKAYRGLAKRYHPDLNPGDKAAESKMREIGEAWEILCDAEKRKAYDQELAGKPKKTPFAPEASKPMSTHMGQVDYESLMKNFDSYFSSDKIKGAAQKSANNTNPIDTTAMFERFMGFTGPKGKK